MWFVQEKDKGKLAESIEAWMKSTPVEALLDWIKCIRDELPSKQGKLALMIPQGDVYENYRAEVMTVLANLAAFERAVEILKQELKVYQPDKKISAETIINNWESLKGL